jgi:RNA polymerase sigma-70 factor, ECF subfamily
MGLSLTQEIDRMPISQEVLKEHLEKEKDKMFRIAWKMCGNPEDAEEIIQETALKALKSWDQFRGESQISTWLYKIASNTCFSKQKRRKNEIVFSQELDGLPKELHDQTAVNITDWSQDPLTHVLNDELREVLDRAIMKLPEMYRIVFLMRDIEGLSGDQIAQILGISTTNVKVRLHRARIFLRDELAEYVKTASGEQK